MKRAPPTHVWNDVAQPIGQRTSAIWAVTQRACNDASDYQHGHCNAVLRMIQRLFPNPRRPQSREMPSKTAAHKTIRAVLPRCRNAHTKELDSLGGDISWAAARFRAIIVLPNRTRSERVDYIHLYLHHGGDSLHPFRRFRPIAFHFARECNLMVAAQQRGTEEQACVSRKQKEKTTTR